MYEKSIAKIIVRGEKLKAFLLRSREKAGMPISHHFCLTQYWRFQVEQLGKKNNKLPKKDIRETAPFTVALKRIKYLGINLSKKVKDSYTENYKRLVKEIKEHTNKERQPMFMDWAGRFNIV